MTPPTTMLYTIAFGVSLVGRGISSLMCVAASEPINDNADCSIPSIHDMPDGHPVVLLKPVKTYVALVFFEVARRVTLRIPKQRRDQITVD